MKRENVDICLTRLGRGFGEKEVAELERLRVK